MNKDLLVDNLSYNKLIRKHVDQSERKIIIFDDDPTGSQTVYDLPIFTNVNYNVIRKAFQDNDIKAFYILTNTRSMSEQSAEDINSKIAQLIDSVSKETGIEYEIISRGDSTLRGHFPLELDVIKRNISNKIDGYILIPFFEEGGRITINDIHYIKENNTLIPVSESQFAKDHTFGFNSSNLREYVEEKSKGLILREDVVSISVEELRSNSASILKKLLNLNGNVCIVNAEHYEDLQVFIIELIKAELKGKNYLFRTAASFVKARLGLDNRPLLDGNMLNIPDNRGGIIVVGSYVSKTTQQINHLIKETGIENIELDISSILSNLDNHNFITDISKILDQNILKGINTLIYTSRKIILGDNNSSSLDVGNKISQSLARIISGLQQFPSFIVAKGGITSNDIATKGLSIEKAMVCGQISKGVPVWRCGSESKFDGLVYIVFPGNVGNDKELTNVVNKLSK